MNLNKTRIANLIGQITTQAAIITASTKHDVCLDFYGSTGAIEVRFYVGGWVSGLDYIVLGTDGLTGIIVCNLNNFIDPSPDYDELVINTLESAISRMQAFASGGLDINKENITKEL